MLELNKIYKKYSLGSQDVMALNGVSLKFKRNEFVSILGPSGCGKTTLLNIIGGLDRYSKGDILIDGVSTKLFKERDWDAYRNATIGFVFQNYNLISHLSILDNVEMALSLTGVSAKERKERATKSLEEVGLIDHLSKKPNQLSGGQMQRVAIARALVNNPKILLADEPTGALDSKTSKQIMELISEISKDRLVIMVTHNPKIAEKYSDRIIKLLDGEVLSDSNPPELDILPSNKTKFKATSMSYLQSFKTSLKNLITKKTRTFITAIAGSIGIIGVSIVLGLSNGMSEYVSVVESDSLAGFPITIDENVLVNQMGPDSDEFSMSEDAFPEEKIIYSFDEEASRVSHKNIIDDEFLDYIQAIDAELVTSVSFTNAIELTLMRETDNEELLLIDNNLSGDFGPFGSTSTFNQLPENNDFVKSQYDVIEGRYPESANEAVLVVDNSNNLTVNLLEKLGYSIDEEYDLDYFIGNEFKVITNDELYVNVNDIFIRNTDLEQMYNSTDSITLRIVGVLRVNQEASSEILSEGLWYTSALTDYLLDDSLDSEIVKAQAESLDINVLTGREFNELVTHESTMLYLGGLDTPVGVQIYPASYDAKSEIKNYINDYNNGKDLEDQIVYSDIAETISGTISTLIDTITLILTALAGVSLVVSSIMIGIITYVSVVERTKEIGVMRSLGARKTDISRIFNAEALLIGLSSGLLGIGIYFLVQSPINNVISNFIEVDGFANLPLTYAAFLIALSSALTLISGLIPSSIAAKKDPVEALRTE